MGIIEERECNWNVVLNGQRVLPRYAYVSLIDWYSHLLSIDHPRIKKLKEFMQDRKKEKGNQYYEGLCRAAYPKILDSIEKLANQNT